MPPLPSIQELSTIIHKCRRSRVPSHALWLHSSLHSLRLDTHNTLGNYLILTLVEIGDLIRARYVFDHISKPNEHSWNFLITGYMKYDNDPKKSLDLYDEESMRNMDVPFQNLETTFRPSGHSFVMLLKACGELNDLDKACQIHAHMARNGIFSQTDVCVDSALVHTYAKCGSLVKAKDVFDSIIVKNLVLYTALISGCVEHGYFDDAICYYDDMQRCDGISSDGVTYVCILKACGHLKSIERGDDIYIEIVKKGFEGDELVGNTLVDMYAKCGLLERAQEVFDVLPVFTVVSWTALIAGYADHGRGEEALYHFENMKCEGNIPPDDATLVCALKACGCIETLNEGQNVHTEIVEKGLEKDAIIGGSLVDMYAKCGSLLEAHAISKNLIARNMFTWTALISGYVESGYGAEALDCFETMEGEGVCPDVATFICSLKACSSIKAVEKGRKMHNEISKKGFESDPVVGNALIDMYTKCGFLIEAQSVVDKLPMRTISSWNTLISAYTEHGCSNEALECYEQMQCLGIPLDVVTFACILKACSAIASIDKGREIHDNILTRGFDQDLFLGNTLVDLYAKSGAFIEAQHIFNTLSVRDVVSWNSLISVHAQVGESEIVFHTFDRMVGEGKKPNLVTFLSVLNVCNHGGLVNKGQMYFEAMHKAYNLNPTLEHYTCMIDLLGRAGHIGDAISVITNMPYHPTIGVWLSVLAACRKWGDIELGVQAFDNALMLDENDTALYVCMSNIYMDADVDDRG